MYVHCNVCHVKMLERHQALGTVAGKLGLETHQVIQAVKLFDEGCTLPFIARYRKEATNSLDETQLSDIQKQIASIDALTAARDKVLSALKSQGLLNPSLQATISKATSISSIEDIYAPYKPKRSTRASAARDSGLLPLAIALLSPSSSSSLPSPKALAQRYIYPPTFPTADSALSGARDIIAEWASELLKGREKARRDLRRYGLLTTKLSRSSSSSSSSSRKKKNNDAKPRKSNKTNNDSNPDTYKNYHAFKAHVKAMQPHQILAIYRGEREGVLSVGFDWNVDPVSAFCRHTLMSEGPPSCIDANNKNNNSSKTQYREPSSSLRGDYMAQIRLAVDDGVKRLLAPAMERELHSELTKTAAEAAVTSFSSNLYALLMQPPLLPAVTVMGLDPAYRSGCKVAVCDGQTSKVVYTGAIYPNPPATESQRKEAGRVFKQVVGQYGVRAVAIGNGTASRETQQFVSQCIASLNHQGSSSSNSKEENRGPSNNNNNNNNNIYDKKASIGWCVVDEVGASVYSASELARSELPNLDVTLRGAVSIARRLQDPLSELVKVQPCSLGVGLYQHDLKKAQLESELDSVVEMVVNRVGVNLNAASTALLHRVAGLNKKTAAAVVKHREDFGSFKRREELRKVKGVGPVVFQQCAGFLRITSTGDDGGVKGNVLDGTDIHPESYAATEKLVRLLMKSDHDGEEDEEKKKKKKKQKVVEKNQGGQGDIAHSDIQAIEKKLISLKQQQDKHNLAEKLGIGPPTLQDIIQSLINLCYISGGEDTSSSSTHQRDARGRAKLEDLQFGQALQLKDLKQGMIINGMIRNSTTFGCFVDCNCGVDGLIHKSMMQRGNGGSKVGEKRGRDQLGGGSTNDGGVQLKIGDKVRVQIIDVDVGRGRLSLKPL